MCLIGIGGAMSQGWRRGLRALLSANETHDHALGGLLHPRVRPFPPHWRVGHPYCLHRCVDCRVCNRARSALDVIEDAGPGSGPLIGASSVRANRSSLAPLMTLLAKGPTLGSHAQIAAQSGEACGAA